MNLKIAKMTNGETIVAHMTEGKRTVNDTVEFIGYIFHHPHTIKLDESQTLMEESGDETVSLVFQKWFPLSKDEKFLVPPDSILTIGEPADEVQKIYMEKVTDG